MSMWDELIDEDTETEARCEAGDWHRSGLGEGACHEIVTEAREHIREGAAHNVTIDVGVA